MPRARNPIRRAAPAVVSHKALLQKESGADIEHYFASTHQVYQRTGRAVVVKQHPPVAGPPTALRYSGGAFVDYAGAIAPRGLMMAFDAKGCTGTNNLHPTPLPKNLLNNEKAWTRAVKDRERLKRQAELLLDLRKMGAAVAFFCVDLKREKLWIVEDVGRVAKLEPVPFRDRDRDLVTSVPFSSLLAIAEGSPSIDYLKYWPIR